MRVCVYVWVDVCASSARPFVPPTRADRGRQTRVKESHEQEEEDTHRGADLGGHVVDGGGEDDLGGHEEVLHHQRQQKAAWGCGGGDFKKMVGEGSTRRVRPGFGWVGGWVRRKKCCATSERRKRPGRVCLFV